MALTPLTENDIINNAYYLLEQDPTVWETDSDEYLTARGLANIGINRWAKYDNTTWRDLWVTNAASSDGVKTTTTALSYAAPTNMARPCSFVRLTDSSDNVVIYDVVPIERVASLAESTANFVYFSGNPDKDGFTLHFNPNLTITAGQTIDYEYYKKPTLFTATSSTTEMSDPYFLSYFIASHMSDEGIDPDLMNMAEARLEQMRVENMSGLFGVSNNIESALSEDDGFGY